MRRPLAPAPPSNHTCTAAAAAEARYKAAQADQAIASSPSPPQWESPPIESSIAIPPAVPAPCAGEIRNDLAHRGEAIHGSVAAVRLPVPWTARRHRRARASEFLLATAPQVSPRRE